VIKVGKNAGAMSAMARKAKQIPRQLSEDQEREFWSKSDSTDYIDWSDARPLVLPNLKPSLKTISLRLPEHMLAELKVLANKRDVPYQSLLKLFLAERLEEELKRIGPSEVKT
jgi:predicted DNA binding CopG/RHH family protein